MGSSMRMNWRFFLRNLLSYLVSLVLLTLFMADSSMRLWESAILVALYLAFVALVVFTNRTNCCSRAGGQTVAEEHHQMVKAV